MFFFSLCLSGTSTASSKRRKGSKFRYFTNPLWFSHTDCQRLQSRNLWEIKKQRTGASNHFSVFSLPDQSWLTCAAVWGKKREDESGSYMLTNAWEGSIQATFILCSAAFFFSGENSNRPLVHIRGKVIVSYLSFCTCPLNLNWTSLTICLNFTGLLKTFIFLLLPGSFDLQSTSYTSWIKHDYASSYVNVRSWKKFSSPFEPLLCDFPNCSYCW